MEMTAALKMGAKVRKPQYHYGNFSIFNQNFPTMVLNLFIYELNLIFYNYLPLVIIIKYILG